MRRALRWGMLASALALTTGVPARAADKVTREAQARFVEGLARVKSGDFEAARISFAQAYVVLHKRDILWNLALAEQKSGHPLDALAHFKQFSREATAPADRSDAAKHITELMAHTGHIEVEAPPGVQVKVDGAAAGTAPLPEALDVTPGRHHLELRTAQGETQVVESDASAGQTARVSFLRGAGTGAGPAAPVAVPVATEPPPVAPAPAPSPDPTPPDTTEPRSSFWGPRGITIVAVGGLAVVAGGLGLGFGLSSSSDASTASTLRQQNPSCVGFTTPGCQQLQSVTQSQHADYVTSEAMWITAGVLAAGAVGTWFLWPRESGSAGVAIVPTAGPGAAGAAAVGSF